MIWITYLRRQTIGLLTICTLVLSLALAACGAQANASNANSNNATNSFSTSQPYQSDQPAHANSSNALQSTDQQVQSLLHQLDGARNDVNTSSSAASQDNGQQP
jgi:hypothetical protein